jgi:hypothetical protein
MLAGRSSRAQPFRDEFERRYPRRDEREFPTCVGAQTNVPGRTISGDEILDS